MSSIDELQKALDEVEAVVWATCEFGSTGREKMNVLMNKFAVFRQSLEDSHIGYCPHFREVIDLRNCFICHSENIVAKNDSLRRLWEERPRKPVVVIDGSDVEWYSKISIEEWYAKVERGGLDAISTAYCTVPSSSLPTKSDKSFLDLEKEAKTPEQVFRETYLSKRWETSRWVSLDVLRERLSGKLKP